MTQQLINIGAAPNDGTGDQLRIAFDKCNDNFTELYTSGAGTTTEGIWNFNQTITDTNNSPTSGRFITNSGNFAGATQIAIHRTSINGIDRANTLRTQIAGDIIKCQDPDNADSWSRFVLQSNAVDNGTWFQLNVTFNGGGGTAPGNNQEIIFSFTASAAGTGFAPLDSPIFTGDPQAPTPATADNDTSIATTAFVKAQGYLVSTDLAAYAPLDSPVFTGDARAPTPTAGDNDTSIATTAFVTAAIAASGGGSDVVPTSGRLSYVSATQLKFAPFAGDKVKINGAIYSIPSAGITAGNTGVHVNGVAGQNLAVSTTYFIYLFDNAGTLTFDFSTTGHATSAMAGNVGVEIKNGDDTRSLIGMCRTNASSQFDNSANRIWLRSWFNPRRQKSQAALTASRSYNSGTIGELNAEMRNEFLVWIDEIVQVTAGVKTYPAAVVNATTSTFFGFDNTTTPEKGFVHTVQSPSTSQPYNGGSITMFKAGLAEGNHFATLLVNTGAGVGTWDGGALDGATTLQIMVDRP